MPEYNEIERMVMELAVYIDGRIQVVDASARKTQSLISNMIHDEIMKFEIKDGSFVVGQDLRKRLMTIQNNIESQLSAKLYTGSIRDFLTDFSTIQNKTVDLFRTVSDLELSIKELSPARQVIYDQAKEGLTKAVKAEYVDPVKKLIAQNVMQGQSINDTVKAIEKWDQGELSSGRLTNGTPTPNLQRYATQIARDTAFSVQRTTNNIFKDKFGLQKFIYAGGLVKDSRPLCVHLVGLNRDISLDEMPPLITAMPEGLYPGTTKDNFLQVCGGYGCRHVAHSV